VPFFKLGKIGGKYLKDHSDHTHTHTHTHTHNK